MIDMNSAEYKELLIRNILLWQDDNRFTREELEKKSIRVLEIIHDSI